MRILFFSHYFPPEGNAPASRVYEMCKRWVKNGHDVDVITCAPNVPNGVVYEGYKNKLYQSESIDGIHVIRVWTYIAANKGTIRRIINYVSYMLSAVFFTLFLKRPDVYSIYPGNPRYLARIDPSGRRHEEYINITISGMA